ncbi:uncharacterized protein LOC116562075 isoform X1 [Sapajus apella]|uniref:Uncharacterized protein LOC116562075 isoform X1 n=1 Tax=Sapajus apella TaxID=9515 RepID=A0A6J3J6D5_SAPAP|nr:uncharacterized protein LOC116562075 isoform X1 [Sapajus apella]
MHPPEGARRRGWAGRAGGAPRAPVCLHLTVPRDHTKMVADVETGTRPSSYGHGRDAERCVEDYWQLAPPPAWRRDVSGMTPRVEKLPSNKMCLSSPRVSTNLVAGNKPTNKETKEGLSRRADFSSEFSPSS